MSDEPTSPPDQPDLRRVRDLYVALTIADETALITAPPLSFSDLVTFISGNLSLSDAQQDFLFANARLLANYRSLVKNFAVPRRSRAQRRERGEDGAQPTEVVHLPLRAAASDDTALTDWIVAGGGGTMRLRAFGPNERLLTIVLDETWTHSPGFLLLENLASRRVALISLARPEPSFASGINIILNSDMPDQARQIEILQNPNSIGTFLR